MNLDDDNVKTIYIHRNAEPKATAEKGVYYSLTRPTRLSDGNYVLTDEAKECGDKFIFFGILLKNLVPREIWDIERGECREVTITFKAT